MSNSLYLISIFTFLDFQPSSPLRVGDSCEGGGVKRHAEQTINNEQ